MLEVVREKFPAWCGKQGKQTLILSDDLDSLVSCAIESYVHNYKINQFYSFRKMYIVNPDDEREPIACDLDLIKGKTWSNHVVRVNEADSVNPEAANLNAMLHVSTENYTKKYAMSTSLMMWSYFNLPLPETIEGKRLLLAIDSSYLGHYNPYFFRIHTAWLKALGFDELVDVLNNSKELDFRILKILYDLDAKIRVADNGKLKTSITLEQVEKLLGIPICFPKETFQLMHQLTHHHQTVDRHFDKDKIDNLYSMALTRKNQIKYSTYE